MKRHLTLTLAGAALCLMAGPLSAGEPASGEVTAVSVLPSPGKAEIVINVRGAVDVKDFVLQEPTRLVVDVMGAQLSGTGATYDGVNRAGILDVRYSQFRPDVVRVVVHLSDLKDYHLDKQGDAIRVSFGAERSFLAWSSTGPSQLAAPAEVQRVRLPEAAPAADAPAPSRGAAAEPRITVTWDKADITDVVAGFAAFSGRTIIVGKDVKGTVSAEIKNQPWPAAFQAVLATQGLQVLELPGGILRVDAPATLAALDTLEPLQTRVIRINYATAPSLTGSVAGLLTKRGKAVADTTTNSIIVTEARSRLDDVEQFIKSLDIRTPQVSIQARLVFVDRTDIQSLGLRYDLGDDQVYFNKLVKRADPVTGLPQDPNTVVIGGNSVAAVANASQQILGNALDVVWRTSIGGFSLTTFLVALQQVDLADIQAEPLITTLDNRQAVINVGQDVPIRVVDASSIGGVAAGPRATVQFKPTGIRLTVTPHVTNNRQILMQVDAERSAIQTVVQTDLGYVINKQNATNQLLVADGETAVIGGLTVTQVTRSKAGIPLLVDLPIVGKLFGFTQDTEERQDLLILITPRIVDMGLQGAS
jgi:type IV pilus assembly protein PilQ